MNQFANLSHNVMLFTALLLVLETWTLAADAPKAAARPNMLLIYTDDHGWADVGLQGARSRNCTTPSPKRTSVAPQTVRISMFTTTARPNVTKHLTSPAAVAWLSVIRSSRPETPGAEERTIYDAGIKNSYPTLIEVEPGEFRCVWDSGTPDKARTHIHFAKLKLNQ